MSMRIKVNIGSELHREHLEEIAAYRKSKGREFNPVREAALGAAKNPRYRLDSELAELKARNCLLDSV